MMRLLLSVLVTAIVALASLVSWQSLRDHEHQQVARVVELESYAARSQLVRNFEDVLAALDAARMIWSTRGEILRTEWNGEAQNLFETIPGTKWVIWDDPGHGARLARHRDAAIDYRPSPEEWRPLSALISHGRELEESTIEGPYLDDSGRPFFEIYLTSGPQRRGAGLLVATIDAGPLLQRLLDSESPGYSVRVDWDDVTLYQRGKAAERLPVEWTQEGYIRSSLDSLWRVEHRPTAELVRSFSSSSMDLILWLGLIIAVLMGILTFENWRAHTRARAAERAERRLANLNRDLEHQIDERTRDLADRTTDLQTVTDSVAHDMRNPLSTIAMNVELFQARHGADLPEGAAGILQRFEPAVQQMANILDRMLSLAEVNHATFIRERLDMAALTGEVYAGLTATGAENPARLIIGDLPDAHADRTLVSTLLTNLLGNALKHTRSTEEPVVRVSASEVDGVTEYCIADNGSGFDQKFASRMFRAFERLEPAKTSNRDLDDQPGGLGLGLSIVARVVERHGGRLRAEGRLGEGAAFFFTLEPQSTSANTGDHEKT
ncbi:sensor histidine kinase [Elongatibacter sediminis]